MSSVVVVVVVVVLIIAVVVLIFLVVVFVLVNADESHGRIDESHGRVDGYVALRFCALHCPCTLRLVNEVADWMFAEQKGELPLKPETQSAVAIARGLHARHHVVTRSLLFLVVAFQWRKSLAVASDVGRDLFF